MAELVLSRGRTRALCLGFQYKGLSLILRLSFFLSRKPVKFQLQPTDPKTLHLELTHNTSNYFCDFGVHILYELSRISNSEETEAVGVASG